MTTDVLNYFLLPLIVLTALFITVAWLQYVRVTQSTSSEEEDENDTTPSAEQLLMREKTLDQLVRRIRSGQPSFIVGGFDSERTFILGYLRNEAPQYQAKLYGEMAEKLIFSYLDIFQFNSTGNPSPQTFWQEVLAPLQDRLKNGSLSSSLKDAYQTCQDNHFDSLRLLDNLIANLQQEGWRFVLMLDRFEEVLGSPLETPEFLGGLRTLASSRTPSPLVLIIAGHLSLRRFHEATRHINPKSSPFLNFMESGVVTLGALPEAEVEQVLQQSEVSFTQEEKQFIKNLTGGHPYLLQIAVSQLWQRSDLEKLDFENAARTFYYRVKDMLANILHSWSPTLCRAFMVVAQGGDVTSLERELGELESQDFIMKDKDGKWQVRPRVFLRLVTEEGPELCNQPSPPQTV